MKNIFIKKKLLKLIGENYIFFILPNAKKDNNIDTLQIISGSSKQKYITYCSLQRDSTMPSQHSDLALLSSLSAIYGQKL